MTLLLILFIIYITGVCVAWFKCYYDAGSHPINKELIAIGVDEKELRKIGSNVAFKYSWLSWIIVWALNNN